MEEQSDDCSLTISQIPPRQPLGGPQWRSSRTTARCGLAALVVSGLGAAMEEQSDDCSLAGSDTPPE